MKPINGINPNMLKKLSVEDIRQMRELRMEGIDIITLAKTFNVNRTTVNTEGFIGSPMAQEIEQRTQRVRLFNSELIFILDSLQL